MLPLPRAISSWWLMGQMMLLVSVHPFSCLFKTQEFLCGLTHTLAFKTFICVLGKAGQIFFWPLENINSSKKTWKLKYFALQTDMLPFKIKSNVSSSLSLTITGLTASRNAPQNPFLEKQENGNSLSANVVGDAA